VSDVTFAGWLGIVISAALVIDGIASLILWLRSK